MYQYALVTTAMGSPYIISRHRSIEAARRAHRRRNPWLYNRDWAARMGMTHSGSFDRIVPLDKDGHIDDREWREDECEEW